jgi:hypothetical protein
MVLFDHFRIVFALVERKKRRMSKLCSAVRAKRELLSTTEV